MRILSVDPGEHTAWVLWDHDKKPLGCGECKVVMPWGFRDAIVSLKNNGPVDICVIEDQFKLPFHSVAGFTSLVERRAWVQGWVSSQWPSCLHIQVQPAIWMKQLGIEKGGDRELFLGQTFPECYLRDQSVHLVDALLIGLWWREYGHSWERFQAEQLQLKKERRAKRAKSKREKAKKAEELQAEEFERLAKLRELQKLHDGLSLPPTLPRS